MFKIMWIEVENKRSLPIINGYLFYFKRANVPKGTRSIYRGSLKKCQASAIFDETREFIIKNDHGHSTNEKKIYKIIFIDK